MLAHHFAWKPYFVKFNQLHYKICQILPYWVNIIRIILKCRSTSVLYAFNIVDIDKLFSIVGQALQSLTFAKT
jgi:hypothetical protein